MGGIFPNALYVARREYLVRVRGRPFAVTTILLAVVVLGVVLLPTILTAVGVDRPTRLAVAAAGAGLAADPVPLIAATLTPPTADGSPPPSGEAPSVSSVEDVPAARAQVRDGDLDGLLIIARAAGDELSFEYVSDDGPRSQTRLLLEQAAGELAINERLEASGVGPEDRDALFAPPSFSAVAADPSAGGTDEDDFGRNLIIAYAVVILTFMAIITYGNWVAQSVAEEKSGRVMELLITAASPRQLLTGKILGTGAAGLTQYAAILAALLVGFAISGVVANALGVAPGAAPELPPLEPLAILVFSLFFLGGFILYSTLYAAAGSMVSRLEDVQQAAGPLMFLAMAGYFSSFVALPAPDATWVTAASQVPFFSPYLMPARILLADPTPLEIAAALAILVATIVVAIWLASRIYAAGVLLYGQRLGWRTVLRATRVAR